MILSGEKLSREDRVAGNAAKHPRVETRGLSQSSPVMSSVVQPKRKSTNSTGLKPASKLT